MGWWSFVTRFVGAPCRAALERMRGNDAFVESGADFLVSGAGPEETMLSMKRLRAGGTALVLVPDLSSKAAVRMAYLMTAAFGKVAVYAPTLFASNQKFLVGCDYKGGEREAGVFTVHYEGEPLYNILLEAYGLLRVNNLFCESLHPKNHIARMHLCGALDLAAELNTCMLAKDTQGFNRFLAKLVLLEA